MAAGKVRWINRHHRGRINVRLEWWGDRLERITSRQIVKAMDAAGDKLVAKSQRRAPVRTGHLRDSIRHDKPRRVDRDLHRMTLYADADYAIYVELGTIYMRPRSFLVPARSSAAQLIRNQLKRGISRM